MDIQKKDSNIYFIYDCEICGNKFFPFRTGHKRCDDCSYIARNIVHHALCSDRQTDGWERKVDSITLLEVSRRYVHATACCYCTRLFSEDNPKSLDHIIPVCLGGQNVNENINISCLDCNRSKYSFPLNKWISLCKLVSSNN
jgi:5-methylcytosine-specific restriction endonuclease McrA